MENNFRAFVRFLKEVNQVDRKRHATNNACPAFDENNLPCDEQEALYRAVRQLELHKAVCAYALGEDVPELKGTAKTLFDTIRPLLDAVLQQARDINIRTKTGHASIYACRFMSINKADVLNSINNKQQAFSVQDTSAELAKKKKADRANAEQVRRFRQRQKDKIQKLQEQVEELQDNSRPNNQTANNEMTGDNI